MILRFVGLLLLVVLALPACRGKSEEAKIRALLDDAVEAVEAGRTGDAFDHVADDYADDAGNDKAQARAILAGQAIRGSRVTIVRRDEKVDVEEGATTATARFDAALFRGDRAKLQGVLPERAGTYRFEFELRKEDGTWLVTKASWDKIPASSFLVNSLGD